MFHFTPYYECVTSTSLSLGFGYRQWVHMCEVFFIFLTFLIYNFKTNPTPTKIPRSSPFGRAKPRGATNT
jgi:hypothetical protein